MPQKTIRVYYREPIGSVRVPVVLVEDRQMHNVSAIWRGFGSPPSKSPARFLASQPGEQYLEALAERLDIPADRLHHYDGEGHWFTHLLAVEYSGWISPHLRVVVNQLAIWAAQQLARKSDPLWQDRRQKGIEIHKVVEDIRGTYDPLIVDGKDQKHRYANAAQGKELLGQYPSHFKRAQGGSDGKESAYNYADVIQLAKRALADAYEAPLQAEQRRYTSDPRRMVDLARSVAREVAEGTRSLDDAFQGGGQGDDRRLA